MTVRELLKTSKGIEEKCGRDRNYNYREEKRNRTLDCDIIFYGDIKLNEADLVIPHPEWQERAFVILPIMDVLDHLTPHQKALVQDAIDIKDIKEIDAGSCRRIENMLD